MEELFNPYQRNAVYTALQIYEKSLLNAMRWLRGDVEEGILVRRELHLPPHLRARAQEKIQEALDEIKQLSEKFGFERKEENIAAELRSEMNFRWVDMCEREASSLKGYGEVNPKLSSELDPSIQRLATLAVQLGLIFQEGENKK